MSASIRLRNMREMKKVAEAKDEEQPLLSNADDDDDDEKKETLRSRLHRLIFRIRRYYPRTLYLNKDNVGSFPANVVCNQKYHAWSFLFVVLYEQFRYFSNLYFLIVALSQFIPALQVGFLFTYLSPLCFVLFVTITKEAWDDIKRWLRDKEANSQKYKKLTRTGIITIPSSDIKVGDMIIVESNQRVPTDMVFLRTSEKTGTCFIRTDQLDGETDWKLRRAISYTQSLTSDTQLLDMQASIYAEKPKKDIYSFIGNFMRQNEVGGSDVESLSVDNTLWTNTVVAAGRVIGITVYTGYETRSVMNTNQPVSKVGRLDLEINSLSKVLCCVLLFLSFLLSALKGFHGLWYIYLFRFLLLFSAIIPISLRVNLDMAKTAYSYFIMKDAEIKDTVVRSSTIPEELGRIQYLLTDKTGTLTQNDMIFKKLHLGSVSFSTESIDEIKQHLRNAYDEDLKQSFSSSQNKIRRTITTRVRDSIRAIAICHNVTPVYEEKEKENNNTSTSSSSSSMRREGKQEDEYEREKEIKRDAPGYLALEDGESEGPQEERVRERLSVNDAIPSSYQASSPDEIALVNFSQSVDLLLSNRDNENLILRTPTGEAEEYEILHIFPFTSESKRMGIIVRDKVTGVITFYEKGADSVMSRIVQYNDWLEEECGNMAREGLRTLVFGKKELTQTEYKNFQKKYHEAKTSIRERDVNIKLSIESIEHDLQLVCLTGVEDKLQDDVKNTLELLLHSGIKVWMLTGDKLETAKCIGISTRLIQRNQHIYILQATTQQQASQMLAQFSLLRDTCLLIDGSTLQLCIENFPENFIQVACLSPAVICCRCSPTQKADIVRLIRKYKNDITCSIGDGGNDVSMIQAANVGIGIVGKEGMQASLAADFSVLQFKNITRLILWHGRNAYKRSAHLSQFIIHRGLIISFIQAVFSALFYFAAIAIYNGWLLVGYATVYTMAPVFSLVLDEDVPISVVFRFPELYKELQKGRVLSLKTFFIWFFTSVYQGGVIMLLSIILFEDNLVNIVAITFTALILTELLNIAFEIHKWNKVMILSEVITALIYFGSIFILKGYFDIAFILSLSFLWRSALVTAVSTFPLYLARYIKRKCDPPSYSKLS